MQYAHQTSEFWWENGKWRDTSGGGWEEDCTRRSAGYVGRGPNGARLAVLPRLNTLVSRAPFLHTTALTRRGGVNRSIEQCHSLLYLSGTQDVYDRSRPDRLSGPQNQLTDSTYDVGYSLKQRWPEQLHASGTHQEIRQVCYLALLCVYIAPAVSTA